MFETVNLKTHALEYNFGASCVGNLFDDGSDLSRIESGRGKKDIELRRKQPKRGDVELTGLYGMSKRGHSTVRGITNQLHNGANGTLDVDSVVAVYSN